MGSDVEEQYYPPQAAQEVAASQEAQDASEAAMMGQELAAGQVPPADADDVPPGEIDPSAAVQEPYGATLLRQAHADGQALMMDYHQAMQVLDNPKVRSHMERILAGLEMNLQKAEAIFAEQYVGCDPLAGCEGDKDMSAMSNTATPADSTAPERPTPEEVAAGTMQQGKALKGKKKDLGQKMAVNPEAYNQGVEAHATALDQGMSRTMAGHRDRQAVTAATGGTEPDHLDTQRSLIEGMNQNEDNRRLRQKSNDSKDCHTLEDYEIKSCACSNCGHEVMLQIPQDSVANEMFPEEGGLYKQALAFLEEISEDEHAPGFDSGWGGKSWGDLERQKSFAYHKVMDDAADESKKSLLKALGVPASMTTGALASSSTEVANRKKRAAGEPRSKSQGDSAMPEQYDPLDASLKLLGVKASYNPNEPDSDDPNLTNDPNWDSLDLSTQSNGDPWPQDDDSVMEKALSWLDSGRGGALVGSKADDSAEDDLDMRSMSQAELAEADALADAGWEDYQEAHFDRHQKSLKKALVMRASRAAGKFLRDVAGRKDFGMRDRERAKSLLASIKSALKGEEATTPEEIAELTPAYGLGHCDSKADKPNSWLSRLRSLLGSNLVNRGLDATRDTARGMAREFMAPGTGAGNRPASKPTPARAPRETLDVFDDEFAPTPKAPQQAAKPQSTMHSGAGRRQGVEVDKPNFARGITNEVTATNVPAPKQAKPTDRKVTVGGIRQPKPQQGYSTGTADASNRQTAPDPAARRAADPKVTSRIATPTTQGHKPTGQGTASNAAPGQGKVESVSTNQTNVNTDDLASYFSGGKSLSATNALLDRAMNLLAAE